MTLQPKIGEAGTKYDVSNDYYNGRSCSQDPPDIEASLFISLLYLLIIIIIDFCKIHIARITRAT